MEIFDYVMRRAGIEYVLMPMKEGLGYGAPGENGTWSGYLGVIQQGAVDTIAADFYPLEARLRAFTFTRPFATEGMLGVAPDTQVTPHFVELAPLLFAMFDLPLWSLITASACACAATMLVAQAR